MCYDLTRPLREFRPSKEFLIGIDSDGCAFDTMEIKHKECFIPNTIKHFGLQPIAKYARQAAEFVNLYSRWRGINRFPALALVLDLLEQHVGVQRRGFAVPRLPAFRQWLARASRPSNPELEAAIREADGSAAEELRAVLEWSRAVNAAIADLVRGVGPFPFVRKCLEKAMSQADAIVVSATPGEALEREWEEHDIARCARVIAGQEMGSKAEQLKLAISGRYDGEAVLMVGDAPGDLEAARINRALFYPVNPGGEAESWERLLKEALDRFFARAYTGDYEAALVAEFEARLPELPPWADAGH